MGHRPMSVIQAVRARCLDCCAGSAQEVRYCTARKCPSWPFRMGVNPWRDKVKISDEERAKRAAKLAAARERRKVPVEATEGGDGA